MMTSRRLNRRQTGYVLAGSMGLSIAMAFAFFVFAMPSALFESIVAASGLSSVLAAAQPPLGQTARLAVAGAAGLFAGTAVAVLFLLADRREESRRKTSMRPFSVASDFEKAHFAPAMAPRIATMAEPVLELAPENVVPAQLQEPAIEQAVQEPEQIVEQVDTGPIFVDFRALRDLQPPVVEKAADAAPPPMPSPRAEAQTAMALESVFPLPRAAATLEDEESIAALMQRLETGLGRRREQGVENTVPPVVSNSSGLRSTLEELRKMAIRR